MTFDQMMEAQQEANRERAKAIRKIEQPDEKPLQGLKLLKQIIADPNEPYSVRMDARRLLEVADLRPRDFQRELSDLIQWRSETSK